MYDFGIYETTVNKPTQNQYQLAASIYHTSGYKIEAIKEVRKEGRTNGGIQGLRACKDFVEALWEHLDLEPSISQLEVAQENLKLAAAFGETLLRKNKGEPTPLGYILARAVCPSKEQLEEAIATIEYFRNK